MAWTDEMIEQLKKMWDEGLTTGEIGRRLNVSKNSIVGKVHRLGLSGRPSPIKKKDQTSETPKSEKKQSAPKEKAKSVAPETKTVTEKPKKDAKNIAKTENVAKADEIDLKFIPAPIKEKTPSKAGQNVSLVELDNHTCRWPIGDPKDDNFHFCGKKVRIGQTYCDEHSAIAYVKPSKK
ncbi:MAG: hypothetical protein E7019_03670 [Alphaproteobacteria bacterium]|nr:hypothetical protein [Alphaproteobacteria bacterium]